ncbi:hypothetical protein HL653_03785 [Sphingomonas sp. AP4-R1]|uniref:hypothetical protein n=1 Tax=Sphingomonas sp. AP4-R1 TaxID=2735134 RepID=UPI001493D195|nr:hypothetical protein [Sphingomonas sp. AP4-R1]QJU57021.1 hypothetical protein HL653_03785 [Sphingomonas sp. AP4-R1]
MKRLVICMAAIVSFPAQAAVVDFSDNFDAGSSPLWSNLRGNWTTSAGSYLAAIPNNHPLTATLLPFEMTDYKITVDALAVGDSGIWLRSDLNAQNGILLVLGGMGYGQGLRGGDSGNSVYFHVVSNGATSPAYGFVRRILSPGSNYQIGVDVTGNTYSVSVNGTLVTSFVNDQFASGYVGLNDNQPNRTTGSGSGAPTSYDNFRLQGSDTSPPAPSPVPRSSIWSMLIAGFGLVGASMRKRRIMIAADHSAASASSSSACWRAHISA